MTSMRLEENHLDFGVPLTSKRFLDTSAPQSSDAAGGENTPTQLPAGPPTTPAPNTKPFMPASMESLDDDLLAFLSLDFPGPDVYDWGSGSQDVSTFEPLRITGSGNSNGSWGNSPLADIAVGFG
jgi:hypothetical protein